MFFKVKQATELASLQTFREDMFGKDKSSAVKMHFQLAKALAVLRIKATAFHALHVAGKHDEVLI